ncbi:MAG: response regulator, partial [Deltaproteobacteria bacterium]|nr:response regulator [Deltaproteobacteria bacterium]
PEPSARTRRVLVIEDNVDAAESLKDLLQLDGHEVRIAFDGPSGLAVARDFRPEVVLCDIGLPGMSGYEVAQRLRSDDDLRDAVLVALTGYSLPEDRQRAAEAGFAHHIAKPPSIEAIERVLASSCSLAPRPG